MAATLSRAQAGDSSGRVTVVTGADGVVVLVGAGAALILYLATLAPSMTFANGAGDSGELASTAFTLGIAHPTGYPLYTLVGFLVTHLVGGEPAHSLNIFSATMGAVCIGVLLLVALCLARRTLPRAPGSLPVVAAALAMAAFTCSAAVWTEAVVAETRTLALALDAVVLALLIMPARPTRATTAWQPLAACFVYGLALCDHLLSFYLAPALVVLVFPWIRCCPSRAIFFLAALVAGLAPYLYLPLRAAMHPAANWGDPETAGRFLWVISGQEYRSDMFGDDASGAVAGVVGALATVWGQLNGATAVAALVGIAVLLRRQTRIAVALALTFAVDIVLTSAYHAPSASAYLSLGFLCVAVAAATGFAALGLAGIRLLSPLPGGDRVRVAAPVVCAASITIVAYAGAPVAASARAAVAHAQSTDERDYGVHVLRMLPRRAVILAQTEDSSIPLWYAQRGLGLRADVIIVATPLLTFDWYYEQMRALAAFDRRLLPRGILSADDGSLAPVRTTLLARALVPGRELYAADVEPAINTLCRQVAYGQIFRCVRVPAHVRTRRR